MIFKDRIDAGKQLAEKLVKYKDNSKAIVLGLPRGGLPVAYEVVKKINLPLDLIVTRKIGAPENPEFALGAIDEYGQGFFNEDYSQYQEHINKEIEKEKKEAQRRLKLYRGDREELELKDKTAILVDDGIATGATMRAAIKSVKAKGADKVVVAVPTTARDSAEIINKEADELIYLDAPALFGAVGAFYENFGQTEDQEVIKIMRETK